MIRNILRWLVVTGVAACGADAPPRADRDGGSPAAAAPRDQRPVVLCVGTSLTAGYGLDPDDAYPTRLQRRADSAGYDVRVVNAGVSGETSAAGVRRIDWLLAQPVDVLLLELGANDALRGQDLAAARNNLQAIIDRTRARYPDVRVVIAGMRAPPNLGARYTQGFEELFVQLARDNGAVLIPFLLAGVAGEPALNQADGIHPNAEGARMVADNVWRVLEPVLRDVSGGASGLP